MPLHARTGKRDFGRRTVDIQREVKGGRLRHKEKRRRREHTVEMAEVENEDSRHAEQYRRRGQSGRKTRREEKKSIAWSAE